MRNSWDLPNSTGLAPVVILIVEHHSWGFCVAKKVELEAHRDAYEAKMEAARQAEHLGLYQHAVQLAVSAWENIDGMMQYKRKYEDAEFKSIAAIELVLRYAPLLFHFESLAKLESLLRTEKRIDKNASDDLASSVASAMTEMWANRRLFNFIEANPECRQDSLRSHLDGDQEYWRWVAEAWEKMGLVCRTPEGGSYRLALATRMGQLVDGKCPGCGHIDRAPKAMFLEEIACPSCGRAVWFVLLSSHVAV
jgi:hypothetical protein